MSDEHLRLTEILARAAAMDDAAERSAYLEESCAGDASLRAEVERLLVAHLRAGDFLERPAAGPPVEENSGEAPGMVIGHYKLLEEIGEGAFGRVFMAEQVEPVRRRVALKVIKMGMDTREVVARFEAERQALALMDHPNIAKVLDAGTTDSGRPYFAMELVNGIPITQFCDARDLPMPERLQLFTQVCHAVQHAHQKAVIHRDLKPGNILVTEIDGKPVPKIIDFGVAKALGAQLTEKTLFTAFQQVIGTPAYMSPEQTALSGTDVDTRSDIYSLGVLLYELLTGVTPIDTDTLHRAGLDEVRRMIRETEPLKPSTRLRTLGVQLAVVARHRQAEPTALTRSIHGDLDWIVMKALEKDRARRYPTITALTEDIERHLTSKPVTAGPPGGLYRTRKFVRRHKFAAALSASAVAAVLLSVAALAYGLVRARQESERADAEARHAKTEAAISSAVNAFLLDDLLGQASPESEPDRDVKLRTLVDRAAEKAGGRFRDQPRVELQVRQTLFRVYRDLGEHESARVELERSKEICRQQGLPAEDPRWLWVQSGEGGLLCSEGRYPESQVLLEQLIPTMRQSLGSEHYRTLDAMHNLAIVYKGQGELDEAREIYEEILPVLRRVLGDEHPDTLDTLHNLAAIDLEQGKLDEAREIYEEIHPVRRRVLGDEHPDTLRARNNLAIVYRKQRKLDDARRIYEEILPVLRKVLGDEHPDTLSTLHSLACIDLDQGKLDDARRILEEIIPVHHRVQGGEHPATLNTLHDLALIDLKQGRLDEAREIYEEILPVLRRVLGDEHPRTLNTLHNLAVIDLKQGRPDEARKIFEEILPVRRRVQGDEHRDTLCALHNLANVYDNQGKVDDARRIYEEILPVLRRVLGDEHPDTLGTLHNLAAIDLNQGKLDDARRVFEEILPVLRKVQGDEHPKTLRARNNLAKVYRELGRPDEARELLEK